MDIVGIQGLPSLLCDAVDPAVMQAASVAASSEPHASSPRSPAPTIAVSPSSAASPTDPLAFTETCASHCYVRSLVMSLWLLQVRDAASTWFAAASNAITASLPALASASNSISTTGSGGAASNGLDSVGSPMTALSPGGAIRPGESTPDGGPTALEGGISGGDGVAIAVDVSPDVAAAMRIRSRCAAELARAAARLALLAHTSHTVRPA